MERAEIERRQNEAYDILKRINPDLQITREMIDAWVYNRPEETTLYIGDLKAINAWRKANNLTASKYKILTVSMEEYIELKKDYLENGEVPYIRTMRGRSDVIVTDVKVFRVGPYADDVKFIKSIVSILKLTRLSKSNEYYCKDGDIKISYDLGDVIAIKPVELPTGKIFKLNHKYGENHDNDN